MGNVLTQTDMQSLIDALNAAMDVSEDNFIEVMEQNKDLFNKRISIKKGFIEVGGGQTMHHQIARATRDEKQCTSGEGDCNLCIPDKRTLLGYDVGSAGWKLFNYINTHDTVKKKYRELFRNSYSIKNDNKYTPLGFATPCNPEFAAFMSSPKSVKSSRSRSAAITDAVKDVAKSVRTSLSNLSQRVASSNITKNRNTPAEEPTKSNENLSIEEPTKSNENLSIEELKSKIDAYEEARDSLHNLMKWDPKGNYKNYNHSFNIQFYNELVAEIKRLQKLLDKKTKKPFFSRVFGKKKGGKTRKYKKTNKRRTYRRK